MPIEVLVGFFLFPIKSRLTLQTEDCGSLAEMLE